MESLLRAEVCGGFDVPVYIHPRTANCIADGCIVCAYRLLVRLPREARQDVLPNARPEQCLRTITRMMQEEKVNSLHQRQNKKKKSKRSRKRYLGNERFLNTTAFNSYRHLPRQTLSGIPESRSHAHENVTSLVPEIRSSEAQVAGLYTSDAHILVIGDGDLSFSSGLCRKIATLHGGNPSQTIVATTYLSHQELEQTYGKHAKANILALKNMGVSTIHNVDATCLGTANCKVLQYMKSYGQVGVPKASGSNSPRFHRIIWNFPCVHSPLDESQQVQRGRDGQNEEMESNKMMLRKFFECSVHFLTPGGEVHLVHKTKPPYNQWNLSDLVAESGMTLQAAVVFDRELYPGYTNRKALVGRGSFPISDARTFIFGSPLVLPSSAAISGTLHDRRNGLILVEDDLLMRVYKVLARRKTEQQLSSKRSRVRC